MVVSWSSKSIFVPISLKTSFEETVLMDMVVAMVAMVFSRLVSRLLEFFPSSVIFLGMYSHESVDH